MKHTLTPLLAIAVLATGTLAHAVDLSQSDIESRQRSKIVRMKARQAAETSQNFNFLNGEGQSEDNSECGSQSIGNFSANRRAGPAPREVFVFAPGAINIVSSNACR